MNKIFESNLYTYRNEFLKDVASHAYKGIFDLDVISKFLLEKSKKNKECFVYEDMSKQKESILQRLQLLFGGQQGNTNVVQPLTDSCHFCPDNGYTVVSCQTCVARRCYHACPRDAISFDEDHHAMIDKTKCINCGLCAKACQYGAIVNYKRPCSSACPVGAIVGHEKEKYVTIDNNKCISCGACYKACPFGAIGDKSFLVDVIRSIVDKKQHKKNVYAIVAPAIASQYNGISVDQIYEGIKQLGFDHVHEVAFGADCVAKDETKELLEQKFLTSSCCPAFVTYMKKYHPNIQRHISSNFSPMGNFAAQIKKHDPNSIIVFVGPCLAKKLEITWEKLNKTVDYVLTFQEVNAMIDAKNIDLKTIKCPKKDEATYYGRVFAYSGGLIEAVKETCQELKTSFAVNPVACSGIKECREAITKWEAKQLPNNFIEGMACVGGCVSGPGSLTHNPVKSKVIVGLHGKQATRKNINESSQNYPGVKK